MRRGDGSRYGSPIITPCWRGLYVQDGSKTADGANTAVVAKVLENGREQYRWQLRSRAITGSRWSTRSAQRIRDKDQEKNFTAACKSAPAAAAVPDDPSCIV